MRNYFYTALLSMFLLGCTYPSSTIGLKIEKTGGNNATLVGSVDALNKKHLVVADALKFSATDGELTCTGSSPNGTLKRFTASHNFPISCSDGRTGVVQLEIKLPRSLGADSSGIGVGKLSDGSKVKIIIGELSGSIGW